MINIKKFYIYNLKLINFNKTVLWNCSIPIKDQYDVELPVFFSNQNSRINFTRMVYFPKVCKPKILFFPTPFTRIDVLFNKL